MTIIPFAKSLKFTPNKHQLSLSQIIVFHQFNTMAVTALLDFHHISYFFPTEGKTLTAKRQYALLGFEFKNPYIKKINKKPS